MEPTAKVSYNKLEKQDVVFSNNQNKVTIVKALNKDSVENIINTLDLKSSKPKSIILVLEEHQVV